MQRLFTLVVVVMMGVSSCVSLPTENQDPVKNNKVTYNKDLKECQEDYPETGSGTHIHQWISCMKLKGWK